MHHDVTGLWIGNALCCVIICVICPYYSVWCVPSVTYSSSSLTSSPSSVYLVTNTHDGFLFSFFFNLPLFVAGLQLILDWLSLPFLSGSRGSLVSSSDAIETPAAERCCARVCVRVYMCLIVPHCSPLMFHWFASSLNAWLPLPQQRRIID